VSPVENKSETLFETLCSAQGLGYSKIKEGTIKTPDYFVEIDGTVFVAEVKQIDPNDEQKKLLAEFKKNKFISVSTTPGEKVRSKIKSSTAQISKLAKGKMPGMLVLYNNLSLVLGDPIEPYNIRVGMFGFDTIVLTKPRDFSAPRIIDKKFGPKRKITKEHNTSISALAVINEKEPIWLDIYHNPYAAIPFTHGIFQKRGNREYELAEKQPLKFQEWEEINP
jgi:hypothetical protein